MQNKWVILIVEDENGISNFISAILTSNQYQVIKCQKGTEAVSMTASYCPDLILLDLGLPDMDGLDVLQAIRQWSEVPIIVVTARSNESEKVKALDFGADDYITKPFGTQELLARIRTAIRHKQKVSSYNPLETDKIHIGDLVVDIIKRTVSVDGKPVHLTPIEYKIVLLLSKHAGKVLTLDAISKEIWGPYTNEQNALRVNMANIRRKIESNPAAPRYILTEVGVGYRMVEE
ncbi:MAG: response regulator with CheY-like receiver domain and winged-helix DNA-binding domain [Oscillospiraceae bacterium]|jgi:two-component system KDP operon response regulator KdpE|nr:response regulator with CheY-like receiver domain and winged-helix DNA-binding domain [Oscillospiraceae bacterium]